MSTFTSVLKLLLVLALLAALIYGYYGLKSWYLAHTGIDISF